MLWFSLERDFMPTETHNPARGGGAEPLIYLVDQKFK